MLVGVVIRQLRGRKVTVVGLLWPVGLVAYALARYLHGVPTAGNDLELVAGGAVVGLGLGCLCGVLTAIHPLPDKSLMAKASWPAALLWVLGVGSRMGFAVYALHGGGHVIARFSTAHDITSVDAWTACFLLMSLTEVLGRTTLLAARSWRVRRELSSPLTVG